jgi:preprotein translocase subunit SecD
MVNFPTWKKVLVALICFIGLAFAAPNFVPKVLTEQLPSWLPNQQVNLGLDLRGGSHLLLEVEVQAVIDEYLEALVGSARDELRSERIRYRSLSKTGKRLLSCCVVSMLVRKSALKAIALSSR